MSTIPDVQRPTDDPFGLLGGAWPNESENSYRSAAEDADDAASLAHAQAESADDAARQTDTGMKGKTADSLLDGYSNLADRLREQSITFTTIAAWTTDAAGKVEAAKRRIRQLAATGTSEIRDVLTSELQGTPASPSSNDLTAKYRDEIARVKTTLESDLDSIGHSLTGDPGSSTTPSYTSVPTAPSAEHPNPTAQVAAYNHGQAPEMTPQKLPEMPRATTSSTNESPSGASTPSTYASSAPHPTLSNLIGGGQGSAPSAGTPSAASPGGTSAPHTSPNPSTSTSTHQAPEHHQDSKLAGLRSIPSIPLPDIPAAAQSIATAVSSATAHQLPTTPSTITPTVPASTGTTPGMPGTSPVTPVTPAPLSPIGGGGLATPAVTQPAPQGTSASPSPAPQQTPPPSPTRSPAADLNWIQQRYGLAPGIEAPKSETVALPALFITKLPEPEAHLHRTLAMLRQQFESAGWSQPLAVATIRKGFESRTVYVTSDGVSIHPLGVSLPHGVTPLDEMPGAPSYSDLSGSLMVSEKLKARIPRGWEIEALLSTVPADENSQTAEQYQELVQGGELLPCTVSRGREGVEAGEAMSVFARAAIGSAGCSELDTESSRLKAARWVGMQPVDYLGLLGRWYLADAAECVSEGRWGEAVYSAEKYLGLVEPKSQAA